VNGIMNMTRVFFIGDIMAEMACEPYMTCNVDQRSFKAYFSRFLALTVKMAPFTTNYIMPKLQTSAKAAARFCSWGEDKNTCGLRWTEGQWEGLWGVGEQLSALETIQSNLILHSRDFVTENLGGTSKGDPGAGGSSTVIEETMRDITAKDRVGAAAVTIFAVVGVLWFGWFVALS